MKLFLTLLARLFNSLPKTDRVLLHWCHIYGKYGLEAPNLVGMVNAPRVTTDTTPSSITETSAVYDTNSIDNDGGANATVRGICYVTGAGGTPTTSDTVVSESGSFGTGNFSATMTGLASSTTYSVRAYATNSAGTGYGDTVEVTTTSVFSPPTVTTQAVTNIVATTATGNGNVTSDGGATITQRGVCWNTLGTPTTANSTATSAGTTGAFTASMTGLTASTLYYVRAYAINAEGTSYGSEVTFTTTSGVIVTPSIATLTTTRFIIGLTNGPVITIGVANQPKLGWGSADWQHIRYSDTIYWLPSPALAPKAPSVFVTNNTSITTANPTALTTTRFTPTVLATNNKTVTTATPTTTITTRFTPTATVSDNKAVTTASPTTLTTTRFTPSVTVSDNKFITTASPSSLTTNRLTPTVSLSDNKFITTAIPSTLVTNRWAITVAATNNVAITLLTASLSTTFYTPTVSLSDNKAITLGVATLTLTRYQPTALSGDNKQAIPGVASLSITNYTPTVTVSSGVIVTPGTTSLTISQQTPTVIVSTVIVPGVASLTLTNYEVQVQTSSSVVITPGIATLTTARFTPIVGITDNKIITLGVASMITAMFAPDVEVYTPAQRVRVWNGTKWVRKTTKVWDGASWEPKPLKAWVDNDWK